MNYLIHGIGFYFELNGDFLLTKASGAKTTYFSYVIVRQLKRASISILLYNIFPANIAFFVMPIVIYSTNGVLVGWSPSQFLKPLFKTCEEKFNSAPAVIGISRVTRVLTTVAGPLPCGVFRRQAFA